MKRGTLLFVVGLLSFGSLSFGADIAVIDSGVDYKHVDLVHNIWENPNHPQDIVADGKTYQNAVRGWNFAEDNNEIIDYKYLGTFSQDCYKIFEVQAKILQGTATESEKDWYKQKKSDQTFLKELQKFGNFIHGTHVSGISANTAANAHIIGMKLIPTEVPGSRMSSKVESQGADNPMALMFLKMLAGKQAEMLTATGKFAASAKAKVANGSFGTSVAAVKPVIEQLLTQILGSAPSEADKEAYAKYFVSEIITASKTFVDASPDTLFVFAAGNDATDNDSMPVSPANIKANNSIAVAATNGTSSLATFSNYGKTMVEVAAPGVAIESSIPGDQHLLLSGTSMAAPFVTNVAGLVVDENPNLSPKEVKEVILKTVDVKSFLQGKVSTSGIVNRDRAVEAARLSRSLPLASAIKSARVRVGDLSMMTVIPGQIERDLIVLPLQNTL